MRHDNIAIKCYIFLYLKQIMEYLYLMINYCILCNKYRYYL